MDNIHPVLYYIGVMSKAGSYYLTIHCFGRIESHSRQTKKNRDEVTNDYESQSYFNAKKLSWTAMGLNLPETAK